MEISINQKHFANSALEMVRGGPGDSHWIVWSGYERHPVENNVYIQASAKPLGSANSEQKHSREVALYRKYARGDWELYSPLVQCPGLFLEFAELGEREINEAVWMDWLNRYGVLGLNRSTLRLASSRGGREETLSRFSEEAHLANRALRLYEVATSFEGVNYQTIEKYASADMLPGWDLIGGNERSRALVFVATLVQSKLSQGCFPKLHLSNLADYKVFEPSYGFSSLLGAMYLQMYWLMTAKGEGRRCKGPGCNRLIAFDQPEQPRDTSIVNDRKVGYRTRIDKIFCSSACKQRAYDRKKSQG